MTTLEQGETTRTRWIIGGLSVLVAAGVAIVLLAFESRPPGAGARSILPEVNASLNGVTGILISIGYLLIRRGKVKAHKACMISACVLAACFLVSYLVHHAQVGSVPFQGTGVLRTVYFIILIPHVLLAAAVVPLALTTVWRAAKGRYEAHKRIARITFPVWLYVSVSGVAVYVMLYHVGA